MLDLLLQILQHSLPNQQLSQLQGLNSIGCSEKIRRIQYPLIHLPQNLQYNKTSTHTSITIKCKPINCKNETSFMYSPLTMQ